MNAKQRDIILVRFPFSDLASSKVRPALVVSNDNYNNRYLDRVVVALTSNLTVAEVKVVVNNSDLVSGSLPQSSAVRVDKPYSVLNSKILKVQATISPAKFDHVIQKLVALFR